jgi:Ca2+-binding EF-hand superfamily protein
MKTRRYPIAFTLLLLTTAANSMADDVVAFATGGYANRLRTPEMMHKIDTDRDGMVSKAEWSSYQQKLFAMIDADSSAALDNKEFMHAHRNDVASFATGGFANALRTSEMFAKLDADSDGNISRDEFVDYHSKLFETMDTRRTGMLGQNEFFGRGPAR